MGMRKTPGRLGLFALFCCCVAVLVAGCNRPEDRVTFGGYYFRTDASPIDKKNTLRDFTVSIRNVEQSLDGARAAGGYEGTRYCIKNFGTSRIDWTVGPATDPQNLRITDGRLSFQGTCDPQ